MKERPILFSAPMVRALLAGTKTQTRRVVKMKSHQQIEQRDDGTNWPWMYDGERDCDSWMACHYGQPGDRLWVKETWRTADTLDALSPSAIAEKCMDAGYSKPWAPLQWEADGQRNREWSGFGPGNGVVVGPGKTRVSIHMPRWASRITLEVTGVRVERLQEIDIADAQAEGVSDTGAFILDGEGNEQGGPIAEYAVLWDQINGDGSWESNPWVWVIEFKRVEGGAQ